MRHGVLLTIIAVHFILFPETRDRAKGFWNISYTFLNGFSRAFGYAQAFFTVDWTCHVTWDLICLVQGSSVSLQCLHASFLYKFIDCAAGSSPVKFLCPIVRKNIACVVGGCCCVLQSKSHSHAKTEPKMEKFEKKALNTEAKPPNWWFRCVVNKHMKQKEQHV